MIPKYADDTAPEHWSDPEKPETLSGLEITPAKSFHERMRRDDAFRNHVEEHQ